VAAGSLSRDLATSRPAEAETDDGPDDDLGADAG